MKKFGPASLLVARTNAADEGAIIRMAQKSRDLRALGHDVVSLTVGEPDFDTPDNIQQAATRAMNCVRPLVAAITSSRKKSRTLIKSSSLRGSSSPPGAVAAGTITLPGIMRLTQSTWHSELRRPMAGRSTLRSAPCR